MTSPHESNGLRLGIIAFAVAYAFFAWFEVAFSPIGLAPQLDAAENVEEGQRLFSGDPAGEPFYRSPLYPAFLAFLGTEETGPFVAAFAGLCLHLGSAFLLWSIARKLDLSPWLALSAFALYAVYPLSLFFSALLYDTTLGIFLVLLGIHFGLQKKRLRIVLGGCCLALAALVRPHFLPVALVAPLCFFWTGHNRTKQSVVLAYVPLVVGLLGFGMMNQLRFGEFRVLPWQGAYNLWAANKPEANGLFFKQSVDVSGRGGTENPAKVESILLYGQAHAEEEPPYAIDAMNAHWRGKFFKHVIEHPLQLATLWLSKGYAILHHYEQYNNLTFSFHKSRIFPLALNPLGWGILFVPATFGLLHLFRSRPRSAVALLLLFASYTATLVVFYASARFRLPLVPILVLLALASIGWFQGLHRERKRLLATLCLLPLLAVLVFGSFAGIRSTDTYVQDRLLMANAQAELGRDAGAARWAREVLEQHPDRKEALRIYAISYFNMALLGNPQRAEFGSWKEQRQWVRQERPTDPVQDAVLGVFLWKWGQRERAVEVWERLVATENASLASSCLAAQTDLNKEQNHGPLVAALRALLKD
jgi:uncharacterized membrane protein